MRNLKNGLKNKQSFSANKEAIEACARHFGIIGDPTRLKICYLLCNYPRLSVSEIAESTDMSISAVSHSLRKLKSANLVESKRDFRAVHYTWINKAIAKILKDQIGQFRGG